MEQDNRVAIRESRDIDVQRAPQVVLNQAITAAKALQDVIAKKARPVVINGETYLEFEDWETLGQFYGYTVQTNAEPIEINGVQGAKGIAQLIDFRTGEVMGGAIAYCMADEERWAERPWFQLSSMAQTRAGAKAFRNRLAWVAVLAGYKPTPYEEMTGDEKPRGKEHWCPIHDTGFRKYGQGDDTWYSHKLPNGKYCNEAKVKEQASRQAQTHDEPAPAQQPSASVDTVSKNVWPAIPDITGTTGLYAWAKQHFNLKPEAVDKYSGGAYVDLEDLRKTAERVREKYGKRPAEAAEDGVFSEEGVQA